jgi:hypothetical protein
MALFPRGAVSKFFSRYTQMFEGLFLLRSSTGLMHPSLNSEWAPSTTNRRNNPQRLSSTMMMKLNVASYNAEYSPTTWQL